MIVPPHLVDRDITTKYSGVVHADASSCVVVDVHDAPSLVLLGLTVESLPSALVVALPSRDRSGWDALLAERRARRSNPSPPPPVSIDILRARRLAREMRGTR